MNDFSEQDLRRLEFLSKISLTEEERKSCMRDIAQVLEYCDILSDVAVDSTESLAFEATTRLRADEEGSLLDLKTFLANAPSSAGALVLVPQVLEE